jgi:RHS repeat-associated protein
MPDQTNSSDPFFFSAFYYDTSDQVIEERVSSTALPLGEGEGYDGETTAAIFAGLPANIQYVWGLRSVNDLVLRDSNNDSGGNLGISGSGLGLRLYAVQDANWNVVALVNSSGAVQERFSYTAYGTATALNPDFTSYSGADYNWTRLFGGMDADPETGLYYDNARWYNPSLGVFTTTDPADADPNTYSYAEDNPVVLTDASGMATGGTLSASWDPYSLDPSMHVGALGIALGIHPDINATWLNVRTTHNPLPTHIGVSLGLKLELIYQKGSVAIVKDGSGNLRELFLNNGTLSTQSIGQGISRFLQQDNPVDQQRNQDKINQLQQNILNSGPAMPGQDNSLNPYGGH